MCGQFVTDPREVKIRKSRSCEFCFKKFDIGSIMTTWSFTDMGKMFSYYCCSVCYKFMQTLNHDDLCEEIGDVSWYEDSYKDFLKTLEEK